MNSKRVLAIVIVALIVFSLTACGKVATVSINDDGLKTELETKLPNTVSKILEEAGISLGEKDVVAPAAGEKLTEAGEILIERMHNVGLTASGTTTMYEIVGGTVADLLEEAGVTLKDKQITSFDLAEPLKEGMTVEVLNQLSVSITCDGETKKQVVNSAIVKDAIEEYGITLGEDDEVTPGLDEKVTDGMEIVIDRVKYETVTETETIAYQVEYRYDASIGRGNQYTSVNGENGEMERVYRVKYVNGEEVETELVEETVTKEPVTAVVLTGPYEVSRVNCPNCSGDGHGYYEVTYSDGSVVWIEY